MRRTSLALLLLLFLQPLVSRGQRPLSAADDTFLDELERASFLFFWEQANPETGLIKDRSLAEGSDAREIASIAATGFGLTALCIGDLRGFISRSEARQRVITTLKFLSTNTRSNEKSIPMV